MTRPARVMIAGQSLVTGVRGGNTDREEQTGPPGRQARPSNPFRFSRSPIEAALLDAIVTASRQAGDGDREAPPPGDRRAGLALIGGGARRCSPGLTRPTCSGSPSWGHGASRNRAKHGATEARRPASVRPAAPRRPEAARKPARPDRPIPHRPPPSSSARSPAARPAPHAPAAPAPGQRGRRARCRRGRGDDGSQVRRPGTRWAPPGGPPQPASALARGRSARSRRPGRGGSGAVAVSGRRGPGSRRRSKRGPPRP